MNKEPNEYDVATTPCRICQKPIGDKSAYCISDEGLAHGECAQREMHERMYGRDPDAPSPETLHATLQNMQRNGGGFVKALAAAWAKADPENSRRLRVAFPEYWSRYSAQTEKAVD